MRARALLIASLTSLCASSASADADELEPAAPTLVQAPFKLVVNYAEHGEIIVVLENGEVLVKREDLAEAGLSVPQGREVEVAGQKLLSLASVSPPLRFELDEREITLRITAPTDRLPSTRVDLGSPPPEILYRRDTSGFLNYAPRISDTGRVDLYEEMGASVGGNLLFSSAYLSNEQRPVRGISNFTIDDRASLRRVTLGDALVLTGPLGSGHFVGGATVARAYALDPYVSTAPHLGYVGTTMTPATVDVYVNGSRVRSEQIQPGTFRLDNLRVGGGSGVASYVIRDVFGNEQTITNPFYIASGVLAKGLSDYTYSVGALRDAVGSQSWGYSRAAALARHRLGLSDAVTVGARAEASQDTISGGPSIDALTPIGQVELELAASRAPGQASGAASFLSYAFISRLFGAGVFGRLMTNHYATLDVGPTLDRAIAEVGVFGSVPVSRRLSLSTQGSLDKYRDRGTTVRGGVQAALRVAPLWTTLLSFSQSRNEDGRTPWEVYVAVTCSMAGGHNATVAARSVEQTGSLLMAANKSVPIGEGYGYRASALVSEHSRADALVQYQTLFGRYAAEYSLESGHSHGALDAAGALVAVPGAGVFPTLPVQDGFGVIRVPGVKGVRGYVNNQEIGSTDRDGNLLVPNLLSYYGNRLSIAQEDVPMQYEMQVTEMTVAPPYRGAAIASFPIVRPHYYRGRVTIDDHGTKVVPKYGQLRITRGEQELATPLGEQGEFEVDGVAPGRRVLAIDYADGTCPLELEIPDSDQVVIELGELVCKVH